MSASNDRLWNKISCCWTKILIWHTEQLSQFFYRFMILDKKFKCILGTANGWAPEDMFAINEREYGVQTTFKSNLEGYTIQLNTDRNSQEYRSVLQPLSLTNYSLTACFSEHFIVVSNFYLRQRCDWGGVKRKVSLFMCRKPANYLFKKMITYLIWRLLNCYWWLTLYVSLFTECFSVTKLITLKLRLVC